MTKRIDIIDGSKYQGRTYGLIYTKRCGWIDLGHANPEGATSIWLQVLHEKDNLGAQEGYFRVLYRQSMAMKNLLRMGVLKKYDVKKGLNLEQKKSVALSIFLDTSHAFESLQSNWFISLVTDSGYSAEDLFSNLVGFYRAVYPDEQFISKCVPVSKTTALEVWDTYGAVGSNKNNTTSPFIYPLPPSKGSSIINSPPKELDRIKPVQEGDLFIEVK